MSFELKIKEIIADNYSGSAAILDKTIKSIQTYINSRGIDTTTLRENLEKVGRSFPDFAVVHHFMAQFFDFLDRLDEGNLSELRKKTRIEAFLNEYTKEWEGNIDLAAEKMARKVDFNKKRILLHSNSSTIHILFKHLAMRNVYPSVYQTMSGPVFEGKMQANVLAELGCKVHFFNEAAIGRFIDEIDFAIVGADNVFTDGFTNKVGTYPLALVCKEANKPFYVMCDSRKRNPVKYASRTSALSERQAPADELWKQAPETIKPVNYYFEYTPSNLVKAFFFEDCWMNMDEKEPEQ